MWIKLLWHVGGAVIKTVYNCLAMVVTCHHQKGCRGWEGGGGEVPGWIHGF